MVDLLNKRVSKGDVIFHQNRYIYILSLEASDISGGWGHLVGIILTQPKFYNSLHFKLRQFLRPAINGSVDIKMAVKVPYGTSKEIDEQVDIIVKTLKNNK